MAQWDKIIVRIWSALLILLFGAIMVLGIFALIYVSILPQIGVIMIVASIFGILIAVCGLLGASFRKKEKQTDPNAQRKAMFLITFFSAMCIFQIAFLICGVALLFLRDSFQLIELFDAGRFLKFMDRLPDNWQKVDKGVSEGVVNVFTKIKDLLVAVGIVLVVVSVFILITVIAAAIRMGITYFSKFFVLVFALIDVGVGLTLAILVIIGFASTSMFKDLFPTALLVPLMSFGFGLSVVGFIGMFTFCLGIRYKAFTVLYNIGNILMVIAFMAMVVIATIYYPSAGKLAEDYCEDDGCKKYVDRANENRCKVEFEAGIQCYTDDDMIKDFKTLFRGVVGLLIFACAYLVFLMSIVVFSTCYLCIKKPKGSILFHSLDSSSSSSSPASSSSNDSSSSSSSQPPSDSSSSQPPSDDNSSSSQPQSDPPPQSDYSSSPPQSDYTSQPQYDYSSQPQSDSSY